MNLGLRVFKMLMEYGWTCCIPYCELCIAEKTIYRKQWQELIQDIGGES